MLQRGVAVDLHVVSAHPAPAAPPPAWVQTGLLRVFAFARLGWTSALSPRPYVVGSRAAADLLPQLASGAPVILFEGLHTTAYLGHTRLADHVQWVRVHNREATYYSELISREAGWRQNLYYRLEARRLRGYEPRVLAEADLLLPISQQDRGWCEALAPGRVHAVPAFGRAAEVGPRLGRGEYILFHAAFHVADNVRSALWLVRLLADAPDYPLVLAGRRPPEALRRAVIRYPHVRLVADPSAEAMTGLIRDAQVIALHTGHSSGYKVKLLESLAQGRWVLANREMLLGAPDLRGGVHQVDTEAGWLAGLREFWRKDFGEHDLAERRSLLSGRGGADAADRLVDLLKESTFNRN